MRLLDVRKLAVKQQARIRFQLAGGMECVITGHGLAKVPQLEGAPNFDLEEEFARAGRFVLEPAATKDKVKPRTLSRGELEALTAGAGKVHEEHDG